MAAALLSPLLWLFNEIVDLYIGVIIAAVVVSWLVNFGVLNLTNPLARQLVQILDALTEPVFRRVRRFVPPIGGLDLSPLVVLLGLELIRQVVNNVVVYLFA